MAPRSKKLKGNTSTAKPPKEYDAERFVSLPTQKRYLDLVMKRGVIQENGLIRDHGQCVPTSEKLKMGGVGRASQSCNCASG